MPRARHSHGGDETAVSRTIEDLRKRCLLRIKPASRLPAELWALRRRHRIEGTVRQRHCWEEDHYKSITLSEPSVTVVGNNAIVRHIFSAETEAEGNQVRHASACCGYGLSPPFALRTRKLLARQAFGLPA